MEIVIKKPYVQYPRPKLIDWSKEKTMTKRSHQKETMMSNIMAKYQKTGLVTHLAQHSPSYGDYSAMDFKTAMDTVVDAQAMFNDLPSNIRNHCQNDPALFLDLVQNPEREAEAISLGLKEQPYVAPAPTGETAPEPAPEPAPDPKPVEPTP